MSWITYDPTPELLAESVRVTRRMQRLAIPTAERYPTKKVAPPGRLITRQAMQAAGLRAVGNPRAAMRVPQFRGSVTDRQPRPPAVVGIMADVSGSMRWSTTGVGEAAWLLARGAAHAGATVASVVFGEGVDPVVFPGDVPQQVVVRSAVDGTESPDLALAALDGGLGLSLPTVSGVPRSRVVVILSDMQWTADQARNFAHRARALAVSGVRFVVLGVSDPFSYSGRVQMDYAVPSVILGMLGAEIPLPPVLRRDPGSAEARTYPSDIREWAAANAADPVFPATALTTAERHARPMGARPVLEPMVVVPKPMLGDHSRATHWANYRANVVRDRIVAHTLRMLEGVE